MIPVESQKGTDGWATDCLPALRSTGLLKRVVLQRKKD